MTRTILVSALILGACTRMDQYYDGKVVEVDGRDFLVRQLSTGSYQALPNEPEMTWHVDAAIWSQNVRAIEDATGCKVDPNSVSSRDSQTIAAVNC